MIRKTALLSAVSAVAFANAAPSKSKTDKPADAGSAPAAGENSAPAPVAGDPNNAATVGNAGSAAKRRERANVTVGAVSSMALPVGVSPSKRGGKSKYPFDTLEAPAPNPNKPDEMLYQSFPISGMDKKGFSSTLFSQNQKFKKTEPKRDANGNIVMKPGAEMRDANGAVVGNAPGTEPETITITTKEFAAYDVDPATDPAGASLRVFRIK